MPQMMPINWLIYFFFFIIIFIMFNIMNYYIFINKMKNIFLNKKSYKKQFFWSW